MSQKQLIAKIAKKIYSQCPIQKIVLEKFITLMKEQKDYFQSFDYLGAGGQSLVLKATNTQHERQVALKIIDCSNVNLKQSIQGLKNEYELLKKFSFNDHLIKIFDCFYLQDNMDEEQEEEEEQKDQGAQIVPKKENIFLVLELEICEHNLKVLFQEFVKNKKNLSQEMIELIAIQMLDGLNSLHTHDIVHRDIKPQNFLVTKEMRIKLSDLGFASALTISKSSLSSKKGTQGYFAPEIYKGQTRTQTDLFALGLTLLELDNLGLLSENWISQDEIVEIYQGKGILSQRQINRKSNIYQIIEICLKPNYKERKSATELLQILISKQQKEIPFLIYSVLIKDLLKQQAKYLIEYYNSKKEKNIEKYQPNNELFVEVLSSLFNNNKYNQSFQFIGFGSEGFVLATKSLQRKQEIVLKVKEVENEEQIKAEVDIMKEINMSLIVQFYESYYIKGFNNKTYVIYEFEKCQCTLQNFLDRTLIDGEKDDQKLSICHQIMASINYLHHFDIIHNDIKLENYLVVINEQDIIVKLSDFGLAVKLSAVNQQFATKNVYGSWLYQAPELYNAKDIRVYTKKTDIFSVGCVLTLLDNYRNFFQPQQYDQDKSTFIYPLAFLTMVQNNFNLPFDPSVFQDKKERINRKSEIYKYIQASVVFNMENRTDFNTFINSNLKQFYTNQVDLQKIIKKSQKNSAPDLRIFKILTESNEEITMEIDINCKELNLDLGWEGIGQDGAKKVSDALSKCSNITQLNLLLERNNIDENGAKSISDALKNCKSMIQLELNLNLNSIGREGAISIASALENNQNINQLKLWLYQNNIGYDGAKSIANVIKTYQNISLLALGLSENNIGDDGAKSVANAIQNCKQITYLDLGLGWNSISYDGAKSVAIAIQNCQKLLIWNFGQMIIRLVMMELRVLLMQSQIANKLLF